MTKRSNQLRSKSERERNRHGLEAALRDREFAAVIARTRNSPPISEPPFEISEGDRPASSCPYCLADGEVSSDQQRSEKGRARPLIDLLRFDCPACRSSWLTDARAAVEHGAFLDRQPPL